MAEREQIWLDEDGNYYQKYGDGEVYRVVGAKTLEEARLDFFTEQIIHRNFGNVRLFLKFFSWLAISDNFAGNPEAYHTSLKAIVRTRQWPSLNHRWQLLHWHTPRTFVWRPPSNLCDPQWLAGDLLASITDTLSAKPYQPLSVPTPIRTQLGPEYVKQADFALETQLRIGDEEASIVQFGGRGTLRWTNASLESDTRVSVGLKANEDGSLVGEELNRFLSVLVWEHGVPVSKRSGPMIGVKRALPLILSPRSIFSLKVNASSPEWMGLALLGTTERLVLSMFREAVNSRSVFYAFLNYWKIIERVFSKEKPRYDWVDQAALGLTFERERVAEIAKKHARISKYLDSNCRNAVVHVFSKPFIDPDSGEDFLRLSLDLPVVRSLAKIAIRTIPAFAS